MGELEDELGFEDDDVVKLLISLLMDSFGVVVALCKGEEVGVGSKGGSWEGFNGWLYVLLFGGAGGGVL